MVSSSSLVLFLTFIFICSFTFSSGFLLTYDSLSVPDLLFDNSLLVHDNSICLNNSLGCPFILDSLSCSSNEVPIYNGSNWGCSLVQNSNIDCSNINDYLFYNDSSNSWLCGHDSDGFNSILNSVSPSFGFTILNNNLSDLNSFFNKLNYSDTYYYVGRESSSISINTFETDNGLVVNGRSKFKDPIYNASILFFNSSKSMINIVPNYSYYTSLRVSRGDEIIRMGTYDYSSIFINNGIHHIVSINRNIFHDSVPLIYESSFPYDDYLYVSIPTDMLYISSSSPFSLKADGDVFLSGDLLVDGKIASLFDSRYIEFDQSVFHYGSNPIIDVDFDSITLTIHTNDDIHTFFYDTSCIPGTIKYVLFDYQSDCNAVNSLSHNFPYLVACISTKADGPNWDLLTETNIPECGGVALY